ncbi:MAG: M20/M25/M40 family metallo-hydrolase, partial [Anaerolineales bacterium]|nr:M20/M25/M40 family metallo-hydrolase [Anaerolineales bacterium]
MDTFELLKTINETPGPSGFEHDIATVIREIWEPLVNESQIDRVGSLIGIKHGREPHQKGDQARRRILLAAHMDELGLMVSNVLEHNGWGYLRVTNLGGVDVRQLYNQRVVVHGRKNLPGLLGAIPGWMLPDKKQGHAYDYETLVVDTGLPYEMVKKTVSVGDAVSFQQSLRKLQNGRVAGKALDNRASVTAVTICLEHLQTRQHEWDVIAVATCQEETRLLGAATTAHTYQPDIAIAIDVTFGNGPGATDYRTFKLGDGPVVSTAPDVHPGVSAAIKKAAKEIEMSTQHEYAPRGGGTDAYYMQIARAGIPTAVVSIPLRYMHTMVESVSL